MVEDEKLIVDESRRVAQHEAIKGAMRNEVNAEMAASARPLDRAERVEAKVVADQMKDKAVAEVVETEVEIDRARAIARVSQVVDYIFYVIYGLIALMIVLDLVGANRRNGFYQFVNSVASVFLAPFRGLVDDPASENIRFRLSYIVALIVYLLVHLAVSGLLRLIAHRRTVV
jgi:hypothetical protein